MVHSDSLIGDYEVIVVFTVGVRGIAVVIYYSCDSGAGCIGDAGSSNNTVQL